MVYFTVSTRELKYACDIATFEDKLRVLYVLKSYSTTGEQLGKNKFCKQRTWSAKDPLKSYFTLGFGNSKLLKILCLTNYIITGRKGRHGEISQVVTV